MLFGNPVAFLYAIPGLLAAIVLHEMAHGYVAYALGDPTPKHQGRLSLNPLHHLDLVGTLMLVVFGFGWAKPVQVNAHRFRHPRQGMMWVALAGPLVNVLLAYIAISLLRYTLSPILQQVLADGALYNAYFAVFNILPVPPLDGSRVLAAISEEGARIVYGMERWGWVALLLLLSFGVLNHLLQVMAGGLLRALAAVAGVNPGF